MNTPNNSEKNLGPQQPSRHFDEPDTQKLVHKHMNDEHHEITDEEFRSVRISTDHIHLDDTQILPRNPDKKTTDEEDTERPVVTPWDVTT